MAFNCPLLVTRDMFRSRRVELIFHYHRTQRLFDADCIFINSNVFRPWWQTRREEIFDFLHAARKNGLKILWFDVTDSTWCTQFQVLPYVDLFLKNQVFSDRKCYLKRYRTGRIFTDYFDNLYNCGERETDYELPDEAGLSKLRISWNTCFENYTEKRYGFKRHIRQKLRPLFSLPEDFKINFTDPKKERKQTISCRIGTSHIRPSVIAHRQAVIAEMGKIGISSGKILLHKYFTELQNSRIGIGPFGVGEITLRDYEFIICGAALVKPDMGHLETWPGLFQREKTYIAYRWDLSDLSKVVNDLLKESERAITIATAAQNIYKKVLSKEGLDTFVERIIKYLEE